MDSRQRVQDVLTGRDRRLLVVVGPCSVHDPVAGASATTLFGAGRVGVAATLAEGIKDAEAIVLVTRWPEYEALPDLLAGRNPQPLVVDGRRVLDRSRVARYEGIGL